MAVTLAQVQSAIAAGSIAGVKTLYTSATAPTVINTRDCPALLPDPAQPLAGSRSDRRTWAGAGWQRARVYQYVALIAEAGAGRAPGENAALLSSVMDATENYLCDLAIPGVISLGPVAIGGAGLVQDASGKQFHGFTVQLTVTSSY